MGWAMWLAAGIAVGLVSSVGVILEVQRRRELERKARLVAALKRLRSAKSKNRNL